MIPASDIPRAPRTKKSATPPADAKQTPICISPEEGAALGKCSARTGRTVAEFVRAVILEGITKLDDTNLTAIPCPFCKRADMLEIQAWTSERADGTEYQGDAVKCNRCDAIAPVESWARNLAPIGGVA